MIKVSVKDPGIIPPLVNKNEFKIKYVDYEIEEEE